jgi:hypothetical protein
MLNGEFMRFCKESEDVTIKSLPDSIIALSEFLSSLPKDFQVVISDVDSFKELFSKDYRSGNWLYWKEMDERIKLLWNTAHFKCNSVLQEIINSINHNNFLVTIILVRSLLEYAAILHYYCWKIVPTYHDTFSNPDIKKIISGEIKGVFTCKELEDLLILYSHGTRKNELISLNEKWKAVHIQTRITFLSKNKDYNKAEEYYNELCEYAHPNQGTNRIFSDIEYKQDKFYISSFTKEQKQNLNSFLELIAYPLGISCHIIQNSIDLLMKTKVTE